MAVRELVFRARSAWHPARVAIHRALVVLDMTEPKKIAPPVFQAARAGAVPVAAVSPIAAFAALIVLVLAFDTGFGPVGGNVVASDCGTIGPSASSSASASHITRASSATTRPSTSSSHASASASASSTPTQTCTSPSASSSISASHSASRTPSSASASARRANR